MIEQAALGRLFFFRRLTKKARVPIGTDPGVLPFDKADSYCLHWSRFC